MEASPPPMRLEPQSGCLIGFQEPHGSRVRERGLGSDFSFTILVPNTLQSILACQPWLGSPDSA